MDAVTWLCMRTESPRRIEAATSISWRGKWRRPSPKFIDVERLPGDAARGAAFHQLSVLRNARISHTQEPFAIQEALAPFRFEIHYRICFYYIVEARIFL